MLLPDAWAFVSYWCDPPIDLNNGFGGGPYLFFPASPGRQPKMTIHNIALIPDKPGRIAKINQATMQNMSTRIVHQNGRLRSWWRLI